MASNINPNNIDTTYPIAGQDNDSQGFRDNFTNIKTNFEYAADEVDDLQAKVLLKSALTGTTLDNDMGGSLITNAKIQGFRATRVSLGALSAGGTATIDYSAGHYHTCTANGSISLAFTNWPSAGNEAWVEVTVTIADPTYTLTLPSAVGANTSATALENIIGRSGQIISFAESGTYTFSFKTSDGGYTVYIQDLTRSTIGSNLSLFDLSNVDQVGNLVNGQLLQYTTAGNANVWVNSTVSIPADLTDLGDIGITSPSEGDWLRYDSGSSTWVNVPSTDSYPLLAYAVTIVDNGSGTQEVFAFDGTKLKTSAGVILDFQFYEGNRYRFDISDPTNADAPLRFSTTPDTNVPSSITDYTDGVTRVGTAGTAGAYVEIVITPETPTPLYFYGQELDPGLDTSLIGAALPIPVRQPGTFYSGSEDLAASAAASINLTTSYFSTASAETATLAAGLDGQIKIFAMKGDGGDMVITVTNPGWSANPTGTITFDAVGDGCTLQYVGSKWFCIGNNGCTFA